MRAPTSPPAIEPSPRLAGNAAWRLAATLARVGVGVVGVALFTRILGISQWGLLALFQAAVAPLALLDGVGRATIKYAAEAIGRGDRAVAARIVRTAVVLNVALGGAGMAALLLASRWLATALFAIPASDAARATLGFRVMGVAWFLGVLAATYSGVLAARQRYDAIARLSTASVVASTACGLAAAALTANVLAVLLAQAAVAAVMAAVYRHRAALLLPELRAAPRADWAAFRRAMAFWAWEVMGVAGGLAAGWSDRWLLGAFFSPALVGFYAVANLLQTQLYGAFLEMGEVLFPAVSHLEGRGDLPAARRLALLVAWALTTGFGVCAVVLAAVGGDFLQLWISPEAARAATETLRLLCISGVLGMTAIAPLYYLLGVGESRWDAWAGVLVGATVLAVGYVLVPRRGLAGVGYGLIAGTAARCGLVLLAWRAHFRPQFGLARFAAHVWAPAAVSIALVAALARAHDALPHAASWPSLVVEAAAAAALAAALQLGASAVTPGGRARLRDVVTSFRPVFGDVLRALRR